MQKSSPRTTDERTSRNILFPAEQYDRLKIEAKRMCLPVSSLIKIYVAEGLDRATDRLVKQNIVNN